MYSMEAGNMSRPILKSSSDLSSGRHFEFSPVGGEPDRLRDLRRGRCFGSLETAWRSAVMWNQEVAGTWASYAENGSKIPIIIRAGREEFANAPHVSAAVEMSGNALLFEQCMMHMKTSCRHCLRLMLAPLYLVLLFRKL